MSTVINIPAGLNFTEIVAKELLKSYPKDPLKMAGVTVWVPAPRQAQTIRQAFIKHSNSSVILPKILPLNLPETIPEIASLIPGTEQEISPLERQTILTKFILTKDRNLSYTNAWELAQELASLMDKLNIHHVTLNDLESLVPSHFAIHWRKNLAFIKIILEAYPAWLKAENYIDSSTLKHKRLLKLADFYNHNSPNLHIWAVGFADTTPAGLEVLKSIYNLQNGHIILPDYQGNFTIKLPPTHPQHSLQNLVQEIRINPDNIMQMPSDNRKQNITIIEAPNIQIEAQIISINMRENLEDNKTCALITPDRRLAHRVQSNLLRWNIKVDDSAGIPLAETPEAKFLLNIANAVSTQLAPIPLAELIKNPFCNGGQSTADWKQLAQKLEQYVLRGQIPDKGLSGLRKRWQTTKNAGAGKAIDILANALQELTNLGFQFSIESYVKAIINAASLLNSNAEKEETWLTKNLKSSLQEWQNTNHLANNFNLQSAAEALIAVLSTSTVHSPIVHPQLFIWGPLEARLQTIDKIIISSLNEGVWPSTPSKNTWLNIAMQQQLCLPNLNRSIGLAAHDLSQFLNHKNITITRSLQSREGENTQSRFLYRWQNKMGVDAIKNAKKKGAKYLDIANKIDAIGKGKPANIPYIDPPINFRPTTWSATTISDLMSCPFKIYGKKILKLTPLDEFAELPDAADRGTLVHTWLQGFFEQVEGLSPPFDESVTLDNIEPAKIHLEKLAVELCEPLPELTKIIWKVRLRKLIPEIALEFLRLSCENIKPIEYEKTGSFIINKITISAIADRLDSTPNGTIIVDYKTGSPPKDIEIVTGKKPQLAVEAWLQSKQAFGNKKPIAGIQVLETAIGSSKGVISHNFTNEQLESKLPNWLIETERGLQNLVSAYNKKNLSYSAVPSKTNCQYCDFSGLCRKAEWENKIDV